MPPGLSKWAHAGGLGGLCTDYKGIRSELTTSIEHPSWWREDSGLMAIMVGCRDGTK